MRSGESNNKYPRRDDINPSRSYNNRVGAPLLAEQQAEAAMHELRDRFELAESNPGDRKIVSDVVGFAWRILTFLGFPDFEAIRQVRTEEFPAIFEPSQHGLVSLALEIVGWYHFGLRKYDIDRTARVFDRCLELTPHNIRALERFAIVANDIQPEDIGGFSKYPKKQQETALGYKLQCKRKVDNILLDVYGITEGHLVGQSPETVAAMMKTKKPAERKFVFNILGHLSQFNLVIGDFFRNGTMLSLGTGAACCQLEMLDLPRDLTSLVLLLKSRFEEEDRNLVAGEETPLVCSILRVIAGIFEAKWRIFQNQAAQRRAQELAELLKEIEG